MAITRRLTQTIAKPSPTRAMTRVIMCVVCLVVSWPLSAVGQRGPIHYFHAADMPPGVIAQGQLLRGGPLPGYVQPVEVLVPEGVKVSFEANGQFDRPHAGPVLAGMLIGPVYRMKITNIPFQEGFEVYPTIEVINRLYPPPGQELRFAVPVQLTTEEIELALSGRYVTRVIYLEDRAHALPSHDERQHQRYFEVAPDQDPLRVADRLGRPMAILRMGSRVPDLGDAQDRSPFGSPPVLLYPEQPEAAPAGSPSSAGPQGNESAIHRHGFNVPRLPLTPRITSSHAPAGYQRAQ